MGNIVLQTGPCSFLYLRIGPWEISFPLLLCSLIPGTLIFYPTGLAPFLSLPAFSPPSLFHPQAQGAAQRQARAGPGSSGPERRAARAERRTAWQAARGRVAQEQARAGVAGGGRQRRWLGAREQAAPGERRARAQGGGSARAVGGTGSGGARASGTRSGQLAAVAWPRAEVSSGRSGRSAAEAGQVLARLGSRPWWRKQARVRGRVEARWRAGRRSGSQEQVRHGLRRG
jgi:hypothetical protein